MASFPDFKPAIRALNGVFILAAAPSKPKGKISPANGKYVAEKLPELKTPPPKQLPKEEKKEKPVRESPVRIVEEPLTPQELQFEQAEAEGIFEQKNVANDISRTAMSHNFVNFLSCAIPRDSENYAIMAGGKEYGHLTGNAQGLSIRRWASCGSSRTREVILLDPTRSPLLDMHYKRLCTQLMSAQKMGSIPVTTELVLKNVMSYVRNYIFPSCREQNLGTKTQKMIDEARSDEKHELAIYKSNPESKVPLISIEEFVKAGTGVCRHHALVTAYLIDRLTRETAYLEGTVQHIRENVHDGAHVWVTFIPKAKEGVPPQKWHVDTLWKKLKNFADAEDYNYLKSKYGDCIDRQVLRTASAAKRNNQPLTVTLAAKPKPSAPLIPVPKASEPLKAQSNAPAVKAPLQENLELEFLNQLLGRLEDRKINSKVLKIVKDQDFLITFYPPIGSHPFPRDQYSIKIEGFVLTVKKSVDFGPPKFPEFCDINLEGILVKEIRIEGERVNQMIEKMRSLLSARSLI